MTDRETIIGLLRKAERRLWADRLFNELSFALALFLLFPLALKACDLFVGFTGTTVAALVGVWFVAFAGYGLTLSRRKVTLANAAAALDKRVALKEELTTAYWFIENSRSSNWIDGQIHRAARRAQSVDLTRLYPRSVPRTIYVAACILLGIIGLNFVPTSGNRNWLALEAAPANQVNDVELNFADIAAALEEIAKDLQQSQPLEKTAEALLEKNLPAAATELRDVAKTLAAVPREEVQTVVERFREASKHSSPDLQPFSQNLKRAADTLEKHDLETAGRALQLAARQLEELGQMMENQLPMNTVRRSLRNFGGGGQSQGQAGEASQQVGQGGWEGALPDNEINPNSTRKTSPVGLESSADAIGTHAQIGASTTLQVQLQKEKLAGQLSRLKRPRSEKASKEERSKIDYRDVPSDLRPAQKDILNQDWIPSRYRGLIKSYFERIRPAE
jgi:hypothetical protein